MRPASRGDLWPGRSYLAADQNDRRRPDWNKSTSFLSRFQARDQTKSDGCRTRVDGRPESDAPTEDEVVVYREPSRGVYKKMVIRDKTTDQRDSLG